VHQDRLGQWSFSGGDQDGTYYYGDGVGIQSASATTMPGQIAAFSRRLSQANAAERIIALRPMGMRPFLASSPDNPNNRFGGWHPGVTLFVLGDGSVRIVSNATSSTALRRLGGRNDKLPFDLP
jgi:hypothetical protein